MDDTLDPPSAVNTPDSTATLLERARAGDRTAIDALFARCIPPLRRWARGRLPNWARDMADTHDVVQDAVIQTFKKMDTFEARGEGALQAYLRQAVMNRIRDHIRRVGRRPRPLSSIPSTRTKARRRSSRRWDARRSNGTKAHSPACPTPTGN